MKTKAILGALILLVSGQTTAAIFNINYEMDLSTLNSGSTIDTWAGQFDGFHQSVSLDFASPLVVSVGDTVNLTVNFANGDLMAMWNPRQLGPWLALDLTTDSPHIHDVTNFTFELLGLAEGIQPFPGADYRPTGQGNIQLGGSTVFDFPSSNIVFAGYAASFDVVCFSDNTTTSNCNGPTSHNYSGVYPRFDAELINVCSEYPGQGDTACVPNTGIPPIPIPAAVWLFGTGILGLIGFSKRSKAV